jgi:ribosome biogenesis protein ENP2
MAMKVATFNGCKVYNLSSGKTMPNWLPEPKRRALAKDEDYRRRLELIQDFENTVASQCIKMTPDGEHIIVTGIYPPVVKCYTVSDLALKFQRGLTCDVIAFETLSEDFGKLVFLQSDRTLNFHAPYGTHYSVRVPKFGRDIAYNWESCDLFVACTGDEIYRLNLEHGQFREPFKLAHSNTTGCNKLHINPTHRLLGCGLDGGVCEFWDMRSRTCASKLIVDTDTSVNVTAIQFDNSSADGGLTLGVGTSNGNCILYDIRSSKPLYTKEHQYGLPVINIAYHNSSAAGAHSNAAGSSNIGTRHVISTDKKIVKIWERDEPNMGKIMTNIETPADINDVLVLSDKRGSTGMLMIAGEQQRIMNYFVPQLGPAPRWCSFLESITEELEENTQSSVYEDYKFLTRAEVEELGAAALIGTPMLKGYMHGFFIEMKLYNKLRAVSKPFEYEEYRLQKIRDKIEEKRQSRITAVKRLPKVNKELAEKMLKQQEKTGEATDSTAANKLVDDRFADLFKREEFQVDETSLDYKLAHPTTSRTGRRNYDEDDDDEDGGEHAAAGDDDEHDLRAIYTRVGGKDAAHDEDNSDYDDDGIDDYDDYGNDDDGEDDEDEDAEVIDKHIRSAGNKSKSLSTSNKRKKSGSGKDDEDEGQIAKASRIAELAARIRAKHAPGQKPTGKKHAGPQLYELADGVDNGGNNAHNNRNSLKAKKHAAKTATSVPMSNRIKDGKGSQSNSHRAGNSMRREMTFMPKSGGKPSFGNKKH